MTSITRPALPILILLTTVTQAHSAVNKAHVLPVRMAGVPSFTGGDAFTFKYKEKDKDFKIKVKVDKTFDWGDFDRKMIRDHCTQIVYTEETDKTATLESVEKILLAKGTIIEATGYVLGVDANEMTLTFDCHSPAPCAGKKLKLKVLHRKDLPVPMINDLESTPIRVQYEYANLEDSEKTKLEDDARLCPPRPPYEIDLGRPIPLIQFIPYPPRLVPRSHSDPREGFQASGYGGIVIDTFASDELQNFVNPEQSGDVRERGVAGFYFEYRLAGKLQSPRQLWIYGETVHGARSSDLDCDGTSNPVSVCSSGSAAGGGAGGTGSEALAIIRNATSLEFFAGLRYELFPLRAKTNSPARFYGLAEAGGIAVSGDGKDVADVNRLGLGLQAIAGPYAGSHLEFGGGTNTLFVQDPHRRLKIDALLKWYPWNNGFSPFAQITVDADLGDGSDSIQTYLGFDFDLDNLMAVRPN